jgi:hypothetical protein
MDYTLLPSPSNLLSWSCQEVRYDLASASSPPGSPRHNYLYAGGELTRSTLDIPPEEPPERVEA